jgi:hypothetical protein
LKPYSLSESDRRSRSSDSSLMGDVSVGVTGALFTIERLKSILKM